MEPDAGAAQRYRLVVPMDPDTAEARGGASSAAMSLASPLRVVRVEFQWAIAAAPAPELICELAIGTVSGAGGR